MESDYIPYIYSDEELLLLIHYADNLEPKSHKACCTHLLAMIPMVLRILYGCGTRLGETMALRRKDIDFKARTCALPGFVDSKNEEKTERNAGYLVVSQSGGGMLRQGTREGIRRTPANRGMRAHRIVKGLDISEDVCHGMCP